MEIRPPPAAVIQVPFYGCRTHLMRLIVDRHLNYWMEASVRVQSTRYTTLIVKWRFGFQHCAGDYRFAGRWSYHLPGPITIGIRHSSK